MWSSGVFLDSWLFVWISSSSICRGVLPRRRESWVSVSIFVGIRFRSRMRRGRISWVSARVSVMMKIFSLVNT